MTHKIQKLPGWFVVLAVIASGAATWWFLRGRGEPPWADATAAAIPSANIAASTQAPAAQTQAPPPVAQAPAPPIVAAPQRLAPSATPLPNGFTRVKVAQRIPAINAGVKSKHDYRGPCTSCHLVLGKNAARVPTIRATARMPHEYRGVCSKCHVISSPGVSAAATVARVKRVRMPNEAEWLGLDVAPLNKLTAMQYDIPPAVRGVVVTEVEGAALQAGFKAGDVVVGVGNTPIPNIAAFLSASAKGKRAGAQVRLLRKGRRMMITLGKAPPAPPRPAVAPPRPGQGVGWRRPLWRGGQRARASNGPRAF